jgi:hypothetical protein
LDLCSSHNSQCNFNNIDALKKYVHNVETKSAAAETRIFAENLEKNIAKSIYRIL